MQFGFGEDQRMLRDTVRDVLLRECGPDVVREAWDHATGHSPSVWSTLADTGVIGMAISENAGGMGMNELDLVLPLEETGYAALPGPFVETVAVGVPLLEAIGTQAQKEKWLPRATLGSALVAVAFEGQPFVAHAPMADLILLCEGDAVYAVPRDEVSLREERSVDRARKLAVVEWTPHATHLMAKGDSARDAIALAFERAILATAVQLLGLSRRMLDMTVQYAKDREQFGKPIGTQQAVKHRLANALIKQEFARPLVYKAAWSLANRAPGYHVDTSMAKIYAAEGARFVAQQALQIHGAIGYTIECDLHMWMKRVWALAPAYGDIAFHRARVETAILPQDN